MRNRKLFKVIIYIMLASMLLSTLVFAFDAFLY